MISGSSSENNKCCIDCLNYIDIENILNEKLEITKIELFALWKAFQEKEKECKFSMESLEFEKKVL